MSRLDINIKKRFSRFLLDVSFDTDEMINGLWGCSGSGKSTLLNCIAGLERPDSGSMIINSRKVFDDKMKLFIKPHKRNVSIVFQDNRLFPHLTVRENLAYSRYKSTTGELVEMADQFKIGHLLDRKPFNLSGGEKKRIAIARTLLSDPDLLLLDEPFAGLDHEMRSIIIKILKDYQAKNNIPMMIVSHDLEEILAFTSSLICLNNGCLRAMGKMKDIFKAANCPGSIFAEGYKNVLQLQAAKSCYKTRMTYFDVFGNNTPPHRIKIRGPFIDSSVPVCCRAVLNSNDITLSLSPVDNISMQNTIPAKITDIIYASNTVFCELDMFGEKIISEITHQSLSQMNLYKNRKVWVMFKAQALNILSTSPCKSLLRKKKAPPVCDRALKIST